MTANMQAEASARVALEAAGLGAWDIVPAAETTSLSRGARLLLGLSPDGEVDCEEFVGALRPADRARCVAALLGAIGSSGESPFRIDVSLARRQARWLRLAGAACVDAAGQVHLVGTIEDVTSEKLNQMRLAGLRHDVSGPLQGIALAVELARRVQSPRTAEVLSRIGSMAARADRMLDQLLQFAASGGDTVLLRRASMALEDVCADAIEELRLAHADRWIRLHATSPCRGEWDRDRLFQLVSNLLGNALKHGQPGAPVDVVLAESARAAVLTVANRGKQIPATTHEQLLDPLRNERWRRDGHGLGLHIVHEIVREHGGSIEVVSDDSRTVISVELPKGDQGMAAASDPQRRAAG